MLVNITSLSLSLLLPVTQVIREGFPVFSSFELHFILLMLKPWYLQLNVL